jgi:hypothetical protein
MAIPSQLKNVWVEPRNCGTRVSREAEQEWWNSLQPEQQQTIEQIQIKVDNGPESSGVRTQYWEVLL